MNNRASLRNFRRIEPSRIACSLVRSDRTPTFAIVTRKHQHPATCLFSSVSNTYARWSASTLAVPMATARCNPSHEKCHFEPSARLRLTYLWPTVAGACREVCICDRLHLVVEPVRLPAAAFREHWAVLHAEAKGMRAAESMVCLHANSRVCQ